MFDEVAITLPSYDSIQTIKLRLCTKEHGCFCEDSVVVNCCAEKKDFGEAEVKLYHSLLNSMRDSLTDFRMNYYHTTKYAVETPTGVLFNTSKSIFKPSNFNIGRPKLYIGIKSSCLNYEKRMAIRNTWIPTANVFYPDIVDIKFIIGDTYNGIRLKSNATIHETAVEVAHLMNLEQSQYFDMLLSEIPVPDDYYTLVNKTTSYFKYLSRKIDDPVKLNVFVLVVDDDVYVNIIELYNYIQQISSQQYYGGRVRYCYYMFHHFAGV